MQEKRHGTARFVLNKEGQLEHLIQTGGYTLHVIVQQQLSFEQLDYVVRQYIAYKHHGKIPLAPDGRECTPSCTGCTISKERRRTNDTAPPAHAGRPTVFFPPPAGKAPALR